MKGEATTTEWDESLCKTQKRAQEITTEEEGRKKRRGNRVTPGQSTRREALRRMATVANTKQKPICAVRHRTPPLSPLFSMPPSELYAPIGNIDLHRRLPVATGVCHATDDI